MENDTRVYPLNELPDYEVADHDPDVRGWEAIAAEGSRIGSVDQLLIDPGAMKVRYLDVELDQRLTGTGEERHVLVPVGSARLDRVNQQVHLDTLRSIDLVALPTYGPGSLTPNFEVALRRYFDSGYRPDTAGRDFYADDLYDEDRFYGKGRGDGETRIVRAEEELVVGTRPRVAGAVDVRKEVETHRVRREVPRQREEVVVERRPIEPGGDAETSIREDEVRIPVTEEELVVGKRAVPREEVVVRKRTIVEEEPVDAELRRERLDIRPDGDVSLREDR